MLKPIKVVILQILFIPHYPFLKVFHKFLDSQFPQFFPIREDRGHNSAVGKRRSKSNQSWDQSAEWLVEIGIDRGNTNWSLKYESVMELGTVIRKSHLKQASKMFIWNSNPKQSFGGIRNSHSEQSSGKVIWNRHLK